MTLTTILQARVSSTRLPGKVFKDLLGKPMLERQIERLRRSQRMQTLVVATSTDPSDDPIEQLCTRIGIDCCRGSLNDVLDRFYQASHKWASDAIIRLTGDCPLADACIIEQIINRFENSGADYASNTLDPTFPDGLDAEVFKRTALSVAWEKASLASEREHVTPYLYKHPELFRLESVRHTEDLSALRWTVDEPEDFEFVSSVYQALYPQNPTFQWTDVLAWVRAHPNAQMVNRKFQRNEGYQRSLQNDSTSGVSS